MGQLLYSTNAWITWYIKNHYYNDVHYVWCSEYFDPEAEGMDHPASLIPVSSSPAEIYRRLEADVRSEDNHSESISRVRSAMTAAATRWLRDDEISQESYEEIISLLDVRGFKSFRPMIYLIPKVAMSPGQIEAVPAGERAGADPEFRISALKGSEFDLIRIRNAGDA